MFDLPLCSLNIFADLHSYKQIEKLFHKDRTVGHRIFLKARQMRSLDMAVGILKTFLGLSASIATSVYSGAYAPQGLDFLLFLAVAPSIMGLLVLPLLNHVPHVEEDEIITHDKKLTTGQPPC